MQFDYLGIRIARSQYYYACEFNCGKWMISNRTQSSLLKTSCMYWKELGVTIY